MHARSLLMRGVLERDGRGLGRAQVPGVPGSARAQQSLPRRRAGDQEPPAAGRLHDAAAGAPEKAELEQEKAELERKNTQLEQELKKTNWTSSRSDAAMRIAVVATQERDAMATRLAALEIENSSRSPLRWIEES